MAKTLFIVIRTVLAFAGIEVSTETAKQIRQVCSWENVKFTFPKIEDAAQDFCVLFMKYWQELHNVGIRPTDDWLARNMVRAFRQNRDEHKFGGVRHLLKAYATEEIVDYLHTGCKIDFEVSGWKTYEMVIRFVNGLLASKRLIIGKAGLIDQLSNLMDLHVQHFCVSSDEYGFATKVVLVRLDDPNEIVANAPAEATLQNKVAALAQTEVESFIIKGDIVIRGINCRIWLNKKSLSGIIKLSDDSDKKLLSFEWGKDHKGEWFKDPKVMQGNTQIRYTGRYVYDQVAKKWTILMDGPNKRNYDIIMAVKDAIIRLYRQKAA